MYKKILSLTLVFLMVCSCFVFSVSAEESLSAEELLMQEMKEAYIEQWLKDYEGAYEAEYFDRTPNYFCYLGEAGYHVFQAAAVPGDPVEPTDEIGDYRFTAFMCMSYCDTNPSGTYAYKDGVLMTLKEAYNKGLVDLDLLYEQTDKTYVMTKLSEEELLEKKCKDAYIKQYELSGEAAENSYVPFAIQFENYTVFRLYPFVVSPMESFQYIDGYWFWEGNIVGDEKENPTGLYTLDNYGNVESLKETADKGFIDMDEIYPELSEATPMYIAGDIDDDKKLTVKDATVIQKYLAKIPEGLEIVNNHRLGYCLMETDQPWAMGMFGSSAEVTIKDATYIQKKVAKIIGGSDDRQPFEYGEILVTTSSEDEKIYTVEDFPEYEFESIERIDLSWGDMYVLKLKNYGKEYVIDAVNSLKYREGKDVVNVFPNWLAYPA